MFRDLVGSFTYYTIHYTHKGQWLTLTPESHPVLNVPPELRRVREGETHYYKSLEPWREFSPNGKVWQARGVCGWETFDEALKAISQLRAWNPAVVEFKALRITITRQVDEVVLARAT